jgi:hypothetical protein
MSRTNKRFVELMFGEFSVDLPETFEFSVDLTENVMSLDLWAGSEEKALVVFECSPHGRTVDCSDETVRQT